MAPPSPKQPPPQDPLTRHEKLIVLFSGAMLVLALGVVDYISGTEISFSIFYVLPVWLVASRAGVTAGCVIALGSAVMWIAADAFSGTRYSHPSILYWNGIVRLGFFLIVAILLHLKRRTETTLQRTQEHFTRLFTFAPEPIIVVDEQGAILQANDQVTQAFGYRQEELLGIAAERLLPERFRAQSGEPGYIAHPKVRRGLISKDLCGLRKDGSEFPLEMLLSPMEATGRLEVMALLRDISGRKRLETQLREYSEGRHHAPCEAQVAKLKGEINAVLAEVGRPKRYDVPSSLPGG